MSESSDEVIDYGGLPKLVSVHPKALSKFAFSRFIERFAFYSVGGLLVYYFMDRYGSSQVSMGFQHYTLLSWAVVLVEIPGGLLVDHLKKHREGILYGGMLISVGYFVLAFGNSTTDIISMGLSLFGLSVYGPSHLAELNHFYQGRKEHFTGGVAQYIAGIELAALLSGITGSTLMIYAGWRQGFMICGILMIVGHIYFILISKPFKERILPKKNSFKLAALPNFLVVLCFFVLGSFLFLLNNQMETLVDWLSSYSNQFSSPNLAPFIASTLTILVLFIGGPYFAKTKQGELNNMGRGIIVFVTVFVAIIGGLSQVKDSFEFLSMIGTLMASLGYAISFFLIVPSAYGYILSRSKKYIALKVAILNVLSYGAFHIGNTIIEEPWSGSISNLGLIVGTAFLTLCAVYFMRKKKVSP